MLPRITQVQVISPYCLALAFTDGSQGRVDLKLWIAGRHGMFAPLHDLDYFARVVVDREAGTVVWPNGVDIDPDVLYEAAHAYPAEQDGNGHALGSAVTPLHSDR